MNLRVLLLGAPVAMGSAGGHGLGRWPWARRSPWARPWPWARPVAMGSAGGNPFTGDAGKTFYGSGKGLGQPNYEVPFVHLHNFCNEAMVRDRRNGEFRSSTWKWSRMRRWLCKSDGIGCLSASSSARSPIRRSGRRKKSVGSCINGPISTGRPTRGKPASSNRKTTSVRRWTASVIEPTRNLFRVSWSNRRISSWHWNTTTGRRPWRATRCRNQEEGYFYAKTDGNSHWSEYTDSIFDSVHIEGDVSVKSVKIRSGGPFTHPSALPRQIRGKPYINRRSIPLTQVDSADADRGHQFRRPSPVHVRRRWWHGRHVVRPQKRGGRVGNPPARHDRFCRCHQSVQVSAARFEIQRWFCHCDVDHVGTGHRQNRIDESERELLRTGRRRRRHLATVLPTAWTDPLPTASSGAPAVA